MQCRSKTWCHNLPCAYSNVMFIISKYDEHMRGGGVYQCVILETYNGSLFMWAIRAKNCPQGLGDERAGASLDTTPASRGGDSLNSRIRLQGMSCCAMFLVRKYFLSLLFGWPLRCRRQGEWRRGEIGKKKYEMKETGERGRVGEGEPESWAV